MPEIRWARRWFLSTGQHAPWQPHLSISKHHASASNECPSSSFLKGCLSSWEEEGEGGGGAHAGLIAGINFARKVRGSSLAQYRKSEIPAVVCCMKAAFPLVMANVSFFTGPPVCRGCGQSTQRRITAPDNRFGNAERPFYTCTNGGCGQYYCFDDFRGIQDHNQPCHCGRPSRRRFGGKAPFGQSFLVLQCALAVCDFSINEPDGEGGQRMIRLGDIPALVENDTL